MDTPHSVRKMGLSKGKTSPVSLGKSKQVIVKDFLSDDFELAVSSYSHDFVQNLENVTANPSLPQNFNPPNGSN